MNRLPITPPQLKTFGYLVSTVSVLMLGWVAWPGASRAGLVPVLVVGMATSILGMVCRWASYEIENRRKQAGLDRRPGDDGNV